MGLIFCLKEYDTILMAGPTRLELATSGLTGQRSNQLNYDPVKRQFFLFDTNTGVNQKLGTVFNMLIACSA